MMKINKSILFIIIIGLFALSCVAIETVSSRLVTPRSLDTNNEFEVIWNISDIQMIYNNRRTDMVGAPGRIIIEGWRTGTISSATIIGLDSVTGSPIWTIPYGTNGDSIITQGEILYRGTVGSAMVQSYNTENGRLLWDTRLPWAHSTSDIYFAENKVFVHTNDGEFFILSEDGEILDTFSETFRTFLEIDDVLYMEDNLAIKAVDFATKKELWRLEIDDQYTHAPIFDDGTIFIRTWNNPAYIYSVNRYTGTINWKMSQDVLSNLYVSGEKIYFISFDGYLVTIQRKTGDEISKVKFSPSFDLNKQNGGYFICGDPTNNVLAVSFGDNAQIMGLKIK